MRKFLFFLIILLTITFASCSNLTTPKKVEVSTSASLKLPLGKLEIGKEQLDFKSILGAETLSNTLRQEMGSSVSLYNYTANEESSNTLTYLLRYPLYSVPVNIGQYFKQMNVTDTFNSNENGAKFSIDISLPEINVQESKSVIDISGISDNFKQDLSDNLEENSFSTSPILEPGVSSGEQYSILGCLNGYESVNISIDNASSIAYSYGSKILIDITKLPGTVCSETYRMYLKAFVCDFDTEIPLRGRDSKYYTEVSRGGTLEIPFDGVMPSKFKIKLDGYTEGGNGITEHTYHVDYSISENFGIDKIIGITASSPEDLGIVLDEVEQDIEISEEMRGKFSEAVINNGAIFIKTNCPAGWEDVICTADIYIEGAGFEKTLIPNSSDITSAEFIKKYLSLEDMSFRPTKDDYTIRISGKIDLDIEGKTIDFTQSDEDSIDTEVNCVIQSLKRATVSFVDSTGTKNDAFENFPLPYTMSEPASPELLEYIRRIEFNRQKHDENGEEIQGEEGESNGLSITCTYTNTFNNLVPITIKSNFLNFDTSDSIDSVSSLATTTSMPSNSKTDIWKNYPVIDLPVYNPLNAPVIDFVVDVGNEVTFTDLIMGSEYSIAITDIKFDFDFDKVVFDASSSTVTGVESIGGLDITGSFANNELLKDQKIALNDVWAYIFVQCDEDSPLKNSSLNGFVQLQYDDPESTTGELIKTDLLPNGDIPFNPKVEWPDSDKPFTSSIKDLSYSNEIELTPILNAKPDDIKVVYDIALTAGDSQDRYLTFYASQMDDTKDQNINIEMAIILPLEITLEKPIEFDFMSMVNPEWNENPTEDLLGRNSSNGNSGNNNGKDSLDLSKYIDYIDFFKMIMTFNNNMFNITENNGLPAFELVLEDSHLVDENGDPKSLTSCVDNRYEITFNSEDIKAISEADYFHPTIKLKVGSENAHFAISRDVIYSPENEEDPENPVVDDSLLSASVILELKLNENNPYVIDLGGAK